jgi:glycosyltransferase involved in cell wall biosynthesis
MPPPEPEPVTIVIPVHNGADKLEPALRAWSEFLQTQLGRGYDLVVIDDGSTDKTPTILEQLVGSIPNLRLLKHDRRRGYGAALRTALAEPTHPILCYTAVDYPYTPSDLTKLLKRLGESVPVYDVHRTVEAVSGCRTGRPVPAVWKLVGRGYRLFLRVALGIAPPPLDGWLGFQEHFRSWVLWLVMGVPLVDVRAAFKVFRRSVFDRFPLQSDSDFVHAEIFAKLTFLSVLVAEEPLTPKPDETPATEWADFWTVFKDAQFHSPPPAVSTPVPP